MDKQQKYDRQLRLWGDHGQRALGNSKIALVNVTATGTEILKNMILPGIGSFTIIDGKRITGEDAGNNFFLDAERIGDSRAKVATEQLLELNPDVRGEYIDDDIAHLLDSSSEFFLKFSAVVVSGLICDESLLRLSQILWQGEVPLILCRSYGFLGYARLVVYEHCIIESHPDNVHDDLRLDVPFVALKKFCDSQDLDAMEFKEHSHTPYVVLLYKYLEKWKAEKGSFPKSWKEKSEFKRLLLTGVREKRNTQGILEEEEENFNEAVRHTNASLIPSNVPSAVQNILNDAKCLNLNEGSKNFWILAAGLRKFMENEGNGLLPLRGNLPDMTSDSERYIQLQSLYKQKAEADVSVIAEHISEICARLDAGNGRISERDIKRFCRNAHFLRVLRSRPIEEEFVSPSKSVLDTLISEPESNVVWYVLFRSVEKFQDKHGRYPGTDDTQLEADVGRLKNLVVELLDMWGVPAASELIKDDCVHEMVRCGAAELHNVASFMGGVLAQEVIKLVTSQYVPINDMFIYNALDCTTMTLKV